MSSAAARCLLRFTRRRLLHVLPYCGVWEYYGARSLPPVRKMVALLTQAKAVDRAHRFLLAHPLREPLAHLTVREQLHVLRVSKSIKFSRRRLWAKMAKHLPAADRRRMSTHSKPFLLAQLQDWYTDKDGVRDSVVPEVFHALLAAKGSLKQRAKGVQQESKSP